MKSNALFFLAVSLDLASVALLIPFMANFVALLGLPSKSLGLVLSIYGACQSISLPIAGALAERRGKRLLLLVSMYGTCLSYIVKTIALYYANVPLFFLSRMMTGFTRHTMTSGAALMLSEAGLSLQRRQESLASFSAAATAGFVAGPALGGLIMERFGVMHLCGTSVCCGISAALLATYATSAPSAADVKEVEKRNKRSISATAMMIARAKSKSPSRSLSVSVCDPEAGDVPAAVLTFTNAPSSSSSLVESLRLVCKSSSALWLFAALFCNSTSYIGLQAAIPVLLRSSDMTTSSPSVIGLIISCSSAFNAISNAVISKQWVRRGASLRATALVLTLCSSSAFIMMALSSFLETQESRTFLFFGGLFFSSLTSGAVDSIAKSSLSMLFADKTALAMSLSYSIDGATRLCLPIINSWLIEYHASAPLILYAVAASMASFSHFMGPTGKEEALR